MNKTYYINLVSFAGIFMADYSGVHWGDREKKKMNATNLEEAKNEALKIFQAHRESQLRLVDNRFTVEHQATLKNNFPSSMEIIEETTHEIRM